MAEEQKPRCWAVPTHWTCGTVGLSFVYAADEAGAAGLATMQTMRCDPAPTGTLTHVRPFELTAAMLRQMLSIVESGKPQSAAVLSLVPTADPGTPAPPLVAEELERLSHEQLPPDPPPAA